eukprot:gene6689-7445_t
MSNRRADRPNKQDVGNMEWESESDSDAFSDSDSEQDDATDGGNANETLESFHVSTTDEEEWTFEKIVERFNRHFVGRTNTIFERARFNRRVQRENEPVIYFIDDLYKLAQTCQFGDLTNELIRDRIVVGIRCQASEGIQDDKGTPGNLKGDNHEAKISFVQRDDSTSRRPKFNTIATPEKEKKCFSCGDNQEEGYSEAFLGSADSDDPKQKCKLVVRIGQIAVEFKIDTGVDVTVIPTSLYNQSRLDTIISTKKKLFGPGQIELNVIGRLATTLVNNKTTIKDDVYVVNDLKEQLLGRPAIEKFDLF